MPENNRYWFPAKRFGWGWGPPSTWKGWVVIGIFFVLLLIGAIELLPGQGPVAFVAYTTVLGMCLVVVCWIKGEPPRWRSGKD